VLIEDKSSGQSLLQDLRITTKLPLVGVIPKYDKLTRMSSASPIIESGRLHLDKRAFWLRDFETELLSFPNGKNDDQVDALSQFLHWFKKIEVAGYSVRNL
jgi:predicted phage terminase large subunit-like protein